MDIENIARRGATTKTVSFSVHGIITTIDDALTGNSRTVDRKVNAVLIFQTRIRKTFLLRLGEGASTDSHCQNKREKKPHSFRECQ